MCVAIYKPAGVEAPSMNVFQDCWDANPDGAGFAYPARDGGIAVCKGHMTFGAFQKAWNNVFGKAGCKHLDVFIHFRIATHGSVSAGNTHPFPLAGDAKTLKKTNGRYKAILMHNGVLPLTPVLKDTSDSMELARRLSFFDGDDLGKAVELLRELEGSNKIAVWEQHNANSSTIRLLGDWKDIDGVKFSNESWRYKSVWQDIPTYYGYGTGGRSIGYLDEDDGEFEEVAGPDDMEFLEAGFCPYCEGHVSQRANGKYKCFYCGTVWREAKLNKRKGVKTA